MNDSFVLNYVLLWSKIKNLPSASKVSCGFRNIELDRWGLSPAVRWSVRANKHAFNPFVSLTRTFFDRLSHWKTDFFFSFRAGLSQRAWPNEQQQSPSNQQQTAYKSPSLNCGLASNIFFFFFYPIVGIARHAHPTVQRHPVKMID